MSIATFINLAPWLVLSVCLIVTLLIWHTVQQNETRKAQSVFDANVNEIHARINTRLGSYSQLLKGVAGFFAASQSMDRNKFRTYVAKQHLEQSYPGIQGIGFARLIAAREKQSQIAAMRREGIPEFDIRPEGTRDPYSAIVYLEPFDWRNQRAIGYDMYSEPTRRAAMESARDNDTSAISGKVVLVQETDKEVQSGILMYYPVYRNNRPHQTAEERRNNLLGWAYEPFRMHDLMSKGVLGSYFGAMREQLDIEIYDGDNPDSQSLMFDLTTSSPVSDLKKQAQFSSTSTTQYFGRNWTIVVRSLPAFESKVSSGQPRTIAIGGVIISLLLTLTVWLLSTTNIRAITLAENMSEKQGRTLTQTIAAMAAVIEMRDPYTSGHQRRAAEIAQAIAVEMELSSEQIHSLHFSGLIYEIGKIQIPAEILSKPGQLDEIEYAMIKSHAQGGFEILQGIEFPWPIAQTVLQHHERLDGSGYPQGLKGDAILLEARIIAVADVVEAMCSHRPYRPAPGIEAALNEIVSGRGTLYDAVVVDACIRIFRERGFTIPD